MEDIINEAAVENNDIDIKEETYDTDENSAGGYGALIAITGLSFTAGALVVKFVVPAIKKGVDKVHEGIVKFLTKDKKDEVLFQVVEETDVEEVKGSDNK